MNRRDVERILVVEDEADIRKFLRVILERAGYEVHEESNGRSGMRTFHEVGPDLVLLDLGLPQLNGWDVLTRIREMSEVPVVILTARGLEAEKVRGLNAGADDYVTKPFSREELLARVAAALRRKPQHGDVSTYADGRLTIDLVGRSVRWDDAEVALTPVEYRLLVALVRHPNQVLSQSQLLEQAWDDPVGVAPNRVKFAIMRLRRKLGCGESGSPIEAVRGFGYRYRPPLRYEAESV